MYKIWRRHTAGGETCGLLTSWNLMRVLSTRSLSRPSQNIFFIPSQNLIDLIITPLLHLVPMCPVLLMFYLLWQISLTIPVQTDLHLTWAASGRSQPIMKYRMVLIQWVTLTGLYDCVQSAGLFRLRHSYYFVAVIGDCLCPSRHFYCWKIGHELPRLACVAQCYIKSYFALTCDSCVQSLLFFCPHPLIMPLGKQKKDRHQI